MAGLQENVRVMIRFHSVRRAAKWRCQEDEFMDLATNFRCFDEGLTNVIGDSVNQVGGNKDHNDNQKCLIPG